MGNFRNVIMLLTQFQALVLQRSLYMYNGDVIRWEPQQSVLIYPKTVSR